MLRRTLSPCFPPPSPLPSSPAHGLSVLASYLTGDGHSVVTAVDAEEAIGCFAGAEFDLLITDHAMPGINGVHLAAAVRTMRSGKPVILAMRNS